MGTLSERLHCDLFSTGKGASLTSGTSEFIERSSWSPAADGQASSPSRLQFSVTGLRQSGRRGKPIDGWNIFLACLLRVVLALAVRVTHLPIGNMKQHFGGLVKP